MKKLTFKQYLNKKLLPYNIALPAGLALATALITAYVILIVYSDSNESFAKAVAPHISTLIETNDRPELQRFISAISKEKDIKIEIYQNNMAIASSYDSELIGSEYKPSGFSIAGIDSRITAKSLIASNIIKRAGGPSDLNASIVVYASTLELILLLFIVTTFIFIVCFLALRVLTSAIIKSAQESIKPIKTLEESIQRLNNFGEIKPSESIKIKELDNIYSAILSTNNKLKASKDKLAKEKAKELSIGAYQKLIHDLHTPVAALKQMTKIINKDGIPLQQKDFAKANVSEIAEQILSQVKASKNNLKLEITPVMSNLTESVKKATTQAQLAKADKENVELIEDYDSEAINILHDNMMLGRAISNIVVNAIEACKNVVKVSVKKTGDEVTVSISDDGEGMSHQDVSLFLQGRGQSKKKSGIGIGLSSAYHIINLHGGKLIFKPSPLGGACFDIRMLG